MESDQMTPARTSSLGSPRNMALTGIAIEANNAWARADAMRGYEEASRREPVEDEGAEGAEGARSEEGAPCEDA